MCAVTVGFTAIPGGDSRHFLLSLVGAFFNATGGIYVVLVSTQRVSVEPRLDHFRLKSARHADFNSNFF